MTRSNPNMSSRSKSSSKSRSKSSSKSRSKIGSKFRSIGSKSKKPRRTQNKRRSFGKIHKQSRQPIQSPPPISPPSSPPSSPSSSQQKSKSRDNKLRLTEFGYDIEGDIVHDVGDLLDFIKSEKEAATYCCYRSKSQKDLVSHIRAVCESLNTPMFDPKGNGKIFLKNLIDKIFTLRGGRTTGNTGSKNEILSNYIRLLKKYKSLERPNKYDIRAEKLDVVVFAVLTKDLINGEKLGGNKYRNKKYKRKHYTKRRKFKK